MTRPSANFTQSSYNPINEVLEPRYGIFWDCADWEDGLDLYGAYASLVLPKGIERLCRQQTGTNPQNTLLLYPTCFHSLLLSTGRIAGMSAFPSHKRKGTRVCCVFPPHLLNKWGPLAIQDGLHCKWSKHKRSTTWIWESSDRMIIYYIQDAKETLMWPFWKLLLRLNLYSSVTILYYRGKSTLT